MQFHRVVSSMTSNRKHYQPMMVSLVFSILFACFSHAQTPTPLITLTPTPNPTPGVVMGRDWALATCNAPWGKREGFACAYLQGRLWLVGGLEHTESGDFLRNDVWFSVNGRDWTLVTEHGPFDPVRGHRLIPHLGLLWIIGGVDEEGLPIDAVWKTSDSVASVWSQLHKDPDRWFSPSVGFSAAVFNDGSGQRMWYMGGSYDEGDVSGEVYASYDGFTWEWMSAGPPTTRAKSEAVAYNGRLVMVGGSAGVFATQNQVSSADGMDWRTDLSAPPYGTRAGHGLAVVDEMWLVGGRDPVDSNPSGDVWRTRDGNAADWEEITSNASFGPREGHGLVSGGGHLWLIGGFNGTDHKADVWFTSSQPGFQATLTAVPTCELTATPTATVTPTYAIELYSTLDWVRSASGIGFPSDGYSYTGNVGSVFNAGEGERM